VSGRIANVGTRTGRFRRSRHTRRSSRWRSTPPRPHGPPAAAR
jgi:hypothetical protein